MCHCLFMLYVKTHQLVEPQIWDGQLSFCFSCGTSLVRWWKGYWLYTPAHLGLMNGITVAGLYIESFKR
jgi:hypothetical protein